MLDQNTDRMWYVIGAVIVGAAMILLMNNAFPELFASVGETFKEKTEDVTKVVNGIGDDKALTDGVMPVPKDDGRPITPDMFSVHPTYSTTSTIDSSNYAVDGSYLLSVGTEKWDGGRIQSQDLNLEPNKTYLVSYNVQKVSGELVTFGGHLDGFFLDHTTYYDGEKSPLTHYSRELDASFMNDGAVHTVDVVITIPDGVENDRLFYIQPNRGQFIPATVRITDFKISEVK